MHHPQRRFLPAGNHGWMRRGTDGAITQGRPQRCHKCGQAVADADALIVRQRDRAMLAPRRRAAADMIDPGAEGGRTLLPGGQKTHCSRMQRMAQIVMRCEQRPRRCLATNDVERDLWPGPKTPPLKEVLRRTIAPVRLQPVGHIFMTGDGNKLLPAPPHRPGQGRTADLGHRAVHHGGKLIADDGIGAGCCRQQPRQCDTKLLPGGQHLKGPQPRRRR